ncbi:MAG: SHOCT domain-containing protein [Planctomycetes bacterium]|nr:SHOCT domain-containing protein [Planctomycetota bacterium]
MSLTRFALIGAFFVLVQSGCTSPWTRTTAYSGSRVFLFYEWQEEDGKVRSLGYSHPCEIADGELSFLLKQLRYEDESVFNGLAADRLLSAEEAGELVKSLRPALAGLSSDKRVRFLVVRKAGKVIPQLLATSGVVFQRGTTLNFAFDSIYEPVRLMGTSGRPGDVTFPYDPEKRELSHGSVVTALPGTRLRRDPRSGKVLHGWVEIDVPMLKRSWGEYLEGPKAGATTVSPKGGSDTGPGDSRPSAKAMRSASEPGKSRVVDTPSVEAQSKADEARLREMSDKLKRLKSLRDRGALTPEEYKAEYDKILMDL